MQQGTLRRAQNQVDQQLAAAVTKALREAGKRNPLTVGQLNPRQVRNLAEVVAPAVVKARELQGELSGRYYQEAVAAAFRGETGGAAIPGVREYAAEALSEGVLAVTRNRASGTPSLERAVVGTAVRHARAAGIDRIRDAVYADERALGWARVHLGSKAPCSFCAMLIGRGPVYKRQQTAGFAAHNACSCHPEPLFRGQGGEYPGFEQADRYGELWGEATAARSGKDALNAFRRAMNA